MFGRPVTPCCRNAEEGEEEHRLNLKQRTGDIKEHHHRSCPRELYPEQHVVVMNKDEGAWHLATVLQNCDQPISDVVQTSNGTQLGNAGATFVHCTIDGYKEESN